MTPPELPPVVKRLKLESALLYARRKFMVKLGGYTWYVSADSEADAFGVWWRIAWMPDEMRDRVRRGAYPTTIRQVP